MKFLKDRDQFINNRINENFDMSGKGSGPLGNDINWGDSLVGRLLNSIARKAKIGIDVKRIETLSNKIKSEFDDLLANAISSTSEDSTLEYIKISYLLGELKKSVDEGKKVKYLIPQTESTIDYVNKAEVSTEEGDYKISQESKDDLLNQLNEFLEFLKQFDGEEGETGLSSEVTGLDEGEDPSKSQEEAEETSSKEQLKYTGMVSLLKQLKLMMDNKSEVLTSAQGESDSKEKSKNIKYVFNNIISSINEFRPGDKKFSNDLLTGSEDVKWPVIEISNNKIIYRKSKKLVEITEDGKLMVDIPKYDETNKRYTGSSKPRLIEFNKENIKMISKYIFNQLNDIQSVINTNKDFKLNKEEIKWFNQNIKGKWLVNESKKGNWYKTKIGECSNNSRVKFLTPPVKNQSDTNVNTILSKGTIFSDKSKADNFYETKTRVLSKKGKVYDKEKQKDFSDKVAVTSESYTLFYDLEFLLEKTVLSGKKRPDGKDRKDANTSEDHLNQSLSKLKDQFKSMEDNGINSNFLKGIIEGSKSTNEEGKPKNIKVIKLLMKDIKDSYNKIGNIGKLFESIEVISNLSKRKQIADKIARFAKFSLQLEGENMYGGLGEIGDPIKEFNKLFKKLLNTEFEEKKSEGKLFTYDSFISEAVGDKIKTKKTSDKIREYFYKNMDYDRWIIEEKDVENIKKDVEESSKEANTYKFDHIIEIVKLFNKAYKIYTKPTIPSGRGGGKVSNKTFREYTYLGSGSPNPSDPGYGPWRNNKIFDKFESSILDIIKSTEYQSIFDENTVIVSGDKKKKGGGKVLLRFINNLLDGDKYYKSGVQQKFIQEYFGLPVGKDKIYENDEDDSKTTRELADSAVVKPDMRFKKTNEIKNIPLTLYALGSGGGKGFIYMMIMSEDENNVYVKHSTSMSQFKKYFKDIKIKKGEVSTIKTETKEIFYGKINKDEFDIKRGSKIKITSISLRDFRKDSQSVNKKESEINIREINVITDDKGNIGKLPKNYVTSYGDEDSGKYPDLKRKLN